MNVKVENRKIISADEPFMLKAKALAITSLKIRKTLHPTKRMQTFEQEWRAFVNFQNTVPPEEHRNHSMLLSSIIDEYHDNSVDIYQKFVNYHIATTFP